MSLELYLSLISSFLSLCSYKTLFIKRNLSWLIAESIKAFEIKSPILFDLNFASNSILSSFFLFFLTIDSYFLLPTVIAQIFNLIPGIVIPIGIPIKETKEEMERHPVSAEPKTMCSI